MANVGERPGSEVVQLYVEPVSPRLTRPLRELKGFAKVHLDPGARTVVALELQARDFACYDPGDPHRESGAGAGPVPAAQGHERRAEPGWWLEPGTYRLVVGRSSAELLGATTVEIGGEPLRLPL